MKQTNATPQKVFYQAKYETGQVMFLVAIFMVAMIAMVGLVVDGGGLYFLERDSQNAVDAAAIAATYELCREGGDDNTATNRAMNTLFAHGFDDEEDGINITVGNPPAALGLNSASSEYIYIELEAEKPNYFIRVVNDNDLSVTVSAVGECRRNESAYANSAIVGVGANCSKDAVNVTGSFNKTMDNGERGFVDGVRSNGGINTKGNGNTYLPINGTYIVPSKDDIKGVQNNNGMESINTTSINGYGPDDPEQMEQVFESGVTNLEVLYHIDWFNINSSLFAQIEGNPDPTVWGGDAVRVVQAVRQANNQGMYQWLPGNKHVNWSLDEETAAKWGGNQPWINKEGVVYVDGYISSSGGGYMGVDGPFTLAAKGYINLSGNGIGLNSAYISPVTLFSWEGAGVTEDDPSTPYYDPNYSGNCNGWAINVSTQNVTWAGLIYAPFGGVNLSMSSSAAPVYGQVIGYTVNVSVSNGQFRFENEFLPSAPPVLGLLQ